MSLSVVAKQANTFRKRVAEANDGACMYMHHALESMNEINELHAKIEKAVEGVTNKHSVVFVDTEANVAVVLCTTYEQRGLDFKYQSVVYDAARDRWTIGQGYWNTASLAYMQGIAETQLGMNNQFALFAQRMLKLEPVNEDKDG